MKAYKILNNDWTCRGFKYEVGGIYEYKGKIKLCESGFHACPQLQNCFKYYQCVPWNKIVEVEILGEWEGDINDKIVTNKIKIVKEIPFEEIGGIIKNSWMNGVEWSKGVNASCGVNRSDGVNESDGVNWSCGVNGSHGVDTSDGVNASKGINKSEGVDRSYGVNISEGVNRSYGINESDGVDRSYGINRSNGVNWSYGVNESHGVNESDGVNISEGVNKSFGIQNCHGISHAIFMKDKQINYTIFGKPVSQNRFEEVWRKIHSKIGNWCPTFNNLPYLYIKNGSKWEKTPIPKAKELTKKEAWKDMPKEAIEYIKSLPEFDAEIFKEITGIDV